MNPKDRQKMCGQCDGRIPYEAEHCPYCGFEPKKELHHRSLQESLTAPYAPSSARHLTPTNPMFDKKNPSLIPPLSAPLAQAAPAEATSVQEGKRSFFPILLLSLAGNLMTIGLLLLLFSDGGTLRLEWDASYWFVYCLIALPPLFLGLKKAGTLKD